jgi:hypothetical protein
MVAELLNPHLLYTKRSKLHILDKLDITPKAFFSERPQSITIPDMENPTDITPVPKLPEDYSDVTSDASQSEKRKYQRGGRRKSERESRLPPVPNPELEDGPRDDESLEDYNERIQQLSSGGQDEGRKQMNGVHDEAAEERQEPVGLDTVCDKCKQKTSQNISPETSFNPEQFATGIRAFNVKRAEASGGRPIGLSTTSKSKKSKKTAPKKKKPKKKAPKEEAESSSEEDSDDDDDDSERKPMSIRLDLNLMVEIFLKAKIKGDVTITFL